jgi:hypothetical protein
MDHPMLDVDDGGLPQFPAEGLDQAMDMMQPDFATANQPEQGGSASDVNGCVPLPALHADRARPAALRRPPVGSSLKRNDGSGAVKGAGLRERHGAGQPTAHGGTTRPVFPLRVPHRGAAPIPRCTDHGAVERHAGAPRSGRRRRPRPDPRGIPAARQEHVQEPAQAHPGRGDRSAPPPPRRARPALPHALPAAAAAAAAAAG